MPRYTEEITEAQYKELLSKLDPKEASIAKRAWGQILRFKKASSPTSVILLIIVCVALWSAYKQVGISEKLIPLLAGIFGLYVAHWSGYSFLQKQHEEAKKLLNDLRFKAETCIVD